VPKNFGQFAETFERTTAAFAVFASGIFEFVSWSGIV